MPIKVFTSETMTPETFGYIGEQECFRYQLTSCELEWYSAQRSGFSTATNLTKYLEDNINSEGVFRVDYYGGELRDALIADNIDHLPCLDKATTLFQITFHLTH